MWPNRTAPIGRDTKPTAKAAKAASVPAAGDAEGKNSRPKTSAEAVPNK